MVRQDQGKGGQSDNIFLSQWLDNLQLWLQEFIQLCTTCMTRYSRTWGCPSALSAPTPYCCQEYIVFLSAIWKLTLKPGASGKQSNCDYYALEVTVGVQLSYCNICWRDSSSPITAAPPSNEAHYEEPGQNVAVEEKSTNGSDVTIRLLENQVAHCRINWKGCHLALRLLDFAYVLVYVLISS